MVLVGMKGAMKSSRGKAESRATTRRLLCELANLRDDGITRFHQMWGRHYRKYTNSELLMRRDELRMLWAKRASYLKKNFTEEDLENAIGVPITKRTAALYDVCELRYPDPLEQVV